MKTNIYISCFSAICIIIAGCMAGCTNKSADPVATSSVAPINAPAPAKNYNEEVQRIQSDPKMPEALKAVQMQSAKERYGPGAAGQPQTAAPK